jgi:hypothetical protein
MPGIPTPQESLERVKPLKAREREESKFYTFPRVCFTLVWENLPESKTNCIRTTDATVGTISCSSSFTSFVDSEI